MIPSIIHRYFVEIDYGRFILRHEDGGFLARPYKKETKAQMYAISRNRDLAYMGNPITSALKEMTVLNNKHIPFRYKTNTRSNRLELLAGLIDSDGWIENNGSSAGYSSIIPQLSNDVAYLCKSLGLAAYVTPKEKYCVYKGQKRFCISYHVSISGDLSCIPTRIARKKNSFS